MSGQGGRRDNEPVDLERLYREEAPKLARYFRRHTHGGEDVSDLVQDSFLRLAAVGRNGGCRRPAAYLQRIARNLLFDRSRRINGRSRLGLEALRDDDLPTPAEQDRAILHEDLMRLYRRALAELPDRTRDIFLLHRVDGLPYREIGARLGIAIPTVQYHVARALVHIDTVLGQE